jgi:hypothetical protein
MGTVEEIKDKLELLKTFEDIGTKEELEKILDIAETYAKLGSPADIEKAFALTESIVTKYQNESVVKEADEIASKYALKTNIVETMIAKHGKDEAVKIIESMRGDISDRYSIRRNRVDPKTTNEDVPDDKKVDESDKSTSTGPRLSRLMNQFSK